MKNHPIVGKVARAISKDYKIGEQLAKALGILFTAASVQQKQKIINTLRRNLPVELKNAIRPGELCENCCEKY